MMRSHYHQTGFSLLELLIALFLTGLLTLLIYGGMKVGLSSWQKIIQYNETLTDDVLSQRLIRRLISTAYPELIEDSIDDHQSVALYGLESEILFLAPGLRFESESTLQWFHFRIRPTEYDKELVLTTAGYRQDEPVDWESLIDELRHGEYTEQYILPISGLESIELHYLDHDEFGNPQWYREWQLLNHLPRAVKVSFESQSESLSERPDLTVAFQEYMYEMSNRR